MNLGSISRINRDIPCNNNNSKGITIMDISKKIASLLEKEQDAEKRIEELRDIKKQLGTQRRKLETILKNASAVLQEDEASDAEAP